eukprot:gene25793-31556_t
MQLYGQAFNEPPVSDSKWFVSTLGGKHATMEFESGCMPKLWVVQAPAASQVNLPPAIHEANKMLLSKACPELVPEDSIQANGAKAAWEFLKTRAVGANKELLPATMQADTLFDVSWSPDSAIIEFHEMTIAYKEFFQVMKREIPKDPMFFNTSQADLYKNLLQVLRAFVAKVNHSREQREKDPLSFTLNMAFLGNSKKQVNVPMGCDLIFVDGPFGMIADAEWDVYSASFYSYMGGLCLTSMDRAGM